jgi:hypothetical protein
MRIIRRLLASPKYRAERCTGRDLSSRLPHARRLRFLNPILDQLSGSDPLRRRVRYAPFAHLMREPDDGE